MKDLLESLEIGEEKVKLSKEEIKTILAKNGEIVKTETEKAEKDLKADIETYKASISELEDKMKNLPKTEDLETLQAELKKIQDAEAERIANESKADEEKILTDNIINVFGDKEFTSDYVKNGLISDIKTELAKAENKGKGISEIFETLTKDKEGIFVNPNAPKDMDGMNPSIPTDILDENRDRALLGLSPKK